VITGRPPGKLPARTEENLADRPQKKAEPIASLPPSSERTPEPSQTSGTPSRTLSRFTPGCVVCESGHAPEVDKDLADGFSARITSLRRNFALYNVNAHLNHFSKSPKPENRSMMTSVKSPNLLTKVM